MDSYRTLIIGPAWVGDMVMAQCLFKLLKQRNPHIIIDVLAPAWTFSLLACMPEVTEAIEMPIAHGELKLKMRYQIAMKVKSRLYQQAIVLPNSFKSALIPFLAKIPKRTGYKREFRHFILNDVRKLDKKRYPLMIEQYMALGIPADDQLPQQYPYPAFEVSSATRKAALHKFKPQMNDSPILAICAGAEFGSSKRWPPEYYAALAKQKLADGWQVWLFGSPKDCDIANTIMQMTDNRCENMTGRTTLDESIALLSFVNGVISNDSGLMHIAAALNKPLIAIYGSTSPAFTPPLSKDAKILKLNLDCQPCFKRECPLTHHRCMRDLTPNMVLAAIHQDWNC